MLPCEQSIVGTQRLARGTAGDDCATSSATNARMERAAAGMKLPPVVELFVRTDPDILVRLERIEKKLDQLLDAPRITGLKIQTKDHDERR